MMKKIFFAILAASLCIAPLSAAATAAEKARREFQSLNQKMNTLLKQSALDEADAVAQQILALELDGTKYLTVIRAFSAKKMIGADRTTAYYKRAMADKGLSLYQKLLCQHFYGAMLLNVSPDEEEKAYALLYAPFTEPGLTLKERVNALNVTRNTFNQRSFHGAHDKLYNLVLAQLKAAPSAGEKEWNNALAELVAWRIGLLRNTPEAARAYCTEALKDPFYAPCRLALVLAKAATYTGRAEAEQAADDLKKEITAKTATQDKFRIYTAMKDLYTDAAKRYYLPDDPAVLRKKLNTLKKMAELPLEKVNVHMDILLLSDTLGDSKTAAETLKNLKNWNGVQKANAALFVSAYLAKKAYCAGDYEKAAELCDQALASGKTVYFYGEPELLDMAVRSAAALRNYEKALSYEARAKKNARKNRHLLEEMNVLKKRLTETGK